MRQRNSDVNVKSNLVVQDCLVAKFENCRLVRCKSHLGTSLKKRPGYSELRVYNVVTLNLILFT